MVSYTDLSSLTANNTNIGEILALPNASYPSFWAWIFAGIWVIFVSTLYYKEKERIGRSRILSAMSISSFVIIVLALLGTVVGFVTLELMIKILVLGIVIIAIWFFSE